MKTEPMSDLQAIAVLAAVAASRHEENLRRFVALEKGLDGLRRYVMLAMVSTLVSLVGGIAEALFNHLH